MNKDKNHESYHQADSELPANMLGVVRYIEKNISNEISLDALANEASISKFHFCKTFKKYFGMSSLKYVTSKRIEMAKRLLHEKTHNISFVAYEAGFSDISSFNKHFRKQTGVTPTTYRLSCRDADPEE